MDKKEKVQLNVVSQACGFSTGGNANRKCDMVYNVPPTAQRSKKRGANPYITSASYESPMKKCLSYVVLT
eukprot:2976867-Ditylum_brightwellii.AAC.1